MLEHLVASRPSQRPLRGVPGLISAALAHGVAIAGAVLLTLPTGSVTPVTSIPVSLVEPFRYGPAAPSTGLPRPPGPVPISTVSIPSPIAFPVVAPSGIPVVGGDSIGSAWLRAWSHGAGGTPGPGVGPGGGAGGTVLVGAALADEPPVLLTRPTLAYPPLLRQAGIEGRVLVEVVIDTLGVPEPVSFRVLAPAHPRFVDAARRIVLGARYRPGRMRGHPVRVLVRQPIVFSLAGP
jgi:TonB family protein